MLLGDFGWPAAWLQNDNYYSTVALITLFNYVPAYYIHVNSHRPLFDPDASLMMALSSALSIRPVSSTNFEK